MRSSIIKMKGICVRIFFVICMILFSACSSRPGEDSKSREEVQNEEKLPDEKDGNNKIIQNVDLSSFFDNLNGCAVLFNISTNQYMISNEEMSQLQYSPYSTFKIISTLIGLENGIIENEASTMKYNDMKYPVNDWNGNLTLKEAFQTSCIWYFRQIIDVAGNDKVENTLENLQYGNCDISEWKGSNINSLEDLNGFWLDSSLKISPYEQIQVLMKIFEGQNGYSENRVHVLKNIMAIADRGGQKIYGKTGSGSTGEAWFVGFSEKEEQKVYFAIYLNDAEQQENISGNKAKEIAMEILDSGQVWQ